MAAEIKSVLRSGDDYYHILGVDKSADEDALKKAYRKLALRLHPDKCKEEGAEEAFKKVGEAFSVLSDSEKRQVYDKYGADGLKQGGGGGGFSGGVSPEDIFEAFFNQGGFPGGMGGGGGTTFIRMGGAGGGPGFVRFSSGGPGNVFTFTSGGPGGFGGPGGMGAAARRRAQREREEEREEEEQEVPEWMKTIQQVLPALGPLLPFVLLAVFVVGMMVIGRIAQFVIQRALIILPIMQLTSGQTRWVLMAAVIVLGLAGIL
eukprot:gnl/TRDRNA2_/TRDRNA2_194344_c0_seq1.p1 gnl/TRDRNA2_/TRDRNA2_194344_c0~~gnl/TRDRNA2_/TRDRNA2_194344_c0_seq1.p1  ORF type:complete len:261 (+),score=71.80 gnl/TRDRNA2_/TRDRNA2_194344_c0_seq1:61-843(+)